MKIKIIFLCCMSALLLSGCNNDNLNSNGENEDNNIEITTETSTIETYETELICDGYFAPTVESEEFLQAYNLASGAWMTQDGHCMINITQEDDGLYYFHLDGSTPDGYRIGIGKYNMYHIGLCDATSMYLYDCSSDEKLTVFNCNDGLMQYEDFFVIQENGEYIRYIDSNGNEYVFYPYDRIDIPVEAYIYIDSNVEVLQANIPEYAEFPDEILAVIDVRSECMEVSPDVLLSDAEAIASCNYANILSMGEYEFTETEIICTAYDSRYGHENIVITFSMNDFSILRIESESGALLYMGE